MTGIHPETRTWLIDYDCGGGEWCFDLECPADEDVADVERRIEAMKRTARVAGEVVNSTEWEQP